MSNEITRFDQIQHYLDGKLTAADRQAFEAEMTTNPALAEEVGVHRLEREMMDILLEDDISNKMQEWQKEKAPLSQTSSGKSKQWQWIVLIAALIGIALLLFYLLRSNSDTIQKSGEVPTNSIPKKETSQPTESEPASKSTKKYNGPVADSEEKENTQDKQLNNDQEENLGGSPALAEAYQRMATEFGGTPEFAGTFVRSAAEAESRFDSASVLIRDKRYDQAIRLLTTIPNENPEIYLNARLNLGYLYFVKKNFSAAIPHLTYAARNRDYLYAETADWYLTLAYLGSGKTAEAEKQLATILKDTEHTYHQKATELEKRLE